MFFSIWVVEGNETVIVLHPNTMQILLPRVIDVPLVERSKPAFGEFSAQNLQRQLQDDGGARQEMHAHACLAFANTVWHLQISQLNMTARQQI